MATHKKNVYEQVNQTDLCQLEMERNGCLCGNRSAGKSSRKENWLKGRVEGCLVSSSHGRDAGVDLYDISSSSTLV